MGRIRITVWGTRSFRIAALGLAVVTAVGVGACTRAGGGPTVPSCAPVGSPAAGNVAPANRAPGGGGLRVVEQGHTQLSTSAGTVSIGAVVENTSKLVAYRTRITFRPLDARGRSVAHEGSGELLRQEIPVILPGQRIGVGAWTYVAEDGAFRPLRVAEIQIDLGTVRWFPPGENFSAITARHLRTERSTVDREVGTVEYVIDSPYCRQLAGRGVVALFRNGSGALVGGTFDNVDSRIRCRPGATEEQIDAFRSLPLGVDDSKTTIYPYCDLAPAVPATGPDAPFN